ncbi:MAG TPA: chloride channel protein [Gemmatimonadales bacterium]
MTAAPVESVARRQRRLLLDSLLLGIGGAASAQLFTLVLNVAQSLFLGRLAGYQPPGLVNEGGSPQEVIGRFGLWLVPVVAAVGGLFCGLLITWLAPEAEGHGTDTAVRAFHRADGALRARVPPLKMLASGLTIGSGGSAGREGPTALVAAGIGSWYAGITHRSPEDRRLLLLIGMSAGLAAIFRSPIGTALFSIEVLYADMEFESGALLYTMLASVVAYAVNGVFTGFRPLFVIPAINNPESIDYVWFTALGLASGLVAVLLPLAFYYTRDLFHKLRIPPAVKPAIGALLTGVIALALPPVIGGGYGWMQRAIDGQLLTLTLLLLVFAKTIAMSLTISSGGSGGVFAPSLYIGTMLGAFFAQVIHKTAAPFAIVGMAAVFAGAARVPMATLMMVTEMTGGYTLLVAAALAVTISYIVQVRLSQHLRYKSLYQEQVPRRADSPAHHTEHLEIALRILEQQRQVRPLEPAGEALLERLRAGVPTELSNDRQLLVGSLRETSAWVGRGFGPERGKIDDEIEILAIMRDERMIAPRPDVRMQAGDKLILLTTAAALERVMLDVAPW